MLGEAAEWGAQEHLLASVIDVLQWSNYLAQAQYSRKPPAHKPQPLKRPGATPAGKRFGSAPIPISDFDAWWDEAVTN